jgi:Carboxypeptidase regulatory-like domain
MAGIGINPFGLPREAPAVTRRAGGGDVTAHRRPLMRGSRPVRPLRLGAAAVIGIAAGVLGAVGGPAVAFADDAPVSVAVTAPADFQPGTTHNVTVTVTNETSQGASPPAGEPGDAVLTATMAIGDAGGGPSSDFTVSALASNGSACTKAGPTCSFVFGANSSVTLVFAVKAVDTVIDIAAGQSHVFDGAAVTITDAQNNTASDGFSVKLFGPPAPPAVVTISGNVYDQSTGLGIPDALVSVNDPAGQTFSGKTDAKGAFKIEAPGPVTPGQLLVGAAKDNYNIKTIAHVTLKPGQAVVSGVQIRLVPVAAPPSAGPSSASSPPDAGASGATPATTDTGTAGDVGGLGATPSRDEGLFSGTHILIAGVILALIGAVAFAIVLLRRRNEDRGAPVTAPVIDRDDGGVGATSNGPASGHTTRWTPSGAAMTATRTSAARVGDVPTRVQPRPIPEAYRDPYAPTAATPAFRPPAPRSAPEAYPDYAAPDYATAGYPGPDYPPPARAPYPGDYQTGRGTHAYEYAEPEPPAPPAAPYREYPAYREHPGRRPETYPPEPYRPDSYPPEPYPPPGYPAYTEPEYSTGAHRAPEYDAPPEYEYYPDQNPSGQHRHDPYQTGEHRPGDRGYPPGYPPSDEPPVDWLDR